MADTAELVAATRSGDGAALGLLLQRHPRVVVRRGPRLPARPRGGAGRRSRWRRAWGSCVPTPTACGGPGSRREGDPAHPPGVETVARRSTAVSNLGREPRRFVHNVVAARSPAYWERPHAGGDERGRTWRDRVDVPDGVAGDPASASRRAHLTRLPGHRRSLPRSGLGRSRPRRDRGARPRPVPRPADAQRRHERQAAVAWTSTHTCSRRWTTTPWPASALRCSDQMSHEHQDGRCWC